MKRKLRVSYSLLNTWRSGRIEEAIKFYLKMTTFTNAAMNAGREFDEYTARVVDEQKKLPKELGGTQLNNPITHLKIEVPYNERCILVGEIDIWDEPIIHEIKTGNKSSIHYSHGFQVPIYFLLTEMKGLPCSSAIIHRFNQGRNELDKTLIWKSKEHTDKARNIIDSLYPEIIDYFDRYNIWEKINQS